MEERVASPETLPLACSVGIMAYNEAGNIARAIESILRQQPANAYVAEVIVIASGCTDRTVPIVAEIARKDSRVRLIVQERREGKASAINEFLRVARSPVNLMSSADLVLKDGPWPSRHRLSMQPSSAPDLMQELVRPGMMVSSTAARCSLPGCKEVHTTSPCRATHPIYMACTSWLYYMRCDYLWSRWLYTTLPPRHHATIDSGNRS
jgi:glycosyltransferase involved in cell wall biosynthesis